MIDIGEVTRADLIKQFGRMRGEILWRRVKKQRKRVIGDLWEAMQDGRSDDEITAAMMELQTANRLAAVARELERDLGL